MATSFDMKERLGSGHFGEVWRVMDVALSTIRALKLISPIRVFKPDNIFHEAQVLKSAEHPNVVRVEETGTMADGRIYIAMEYLPKGSLEDEAKGAYVALTRAHRIMIDVLRGLQHAHERKILHCDIKPANIMVGNSNEGKLSDFGLAIPSGVDFHSLGVKDYAYVIHLAPEVIRHRNYSVQSDIYATGVTMYRLVNGDGYLPTIDPLTRRQAILDGEYPNRSRYREFVPRPLRTFINRAMDPLAGRRFKSAEEMRHALERITLQMNWIESITMDGMRWVCGWNNKCYEVIRSAHKNKTWSVEYKKGNSKHDLRRITPLCGKGMSKTKAEQLTRRILQDGVLERLN
ncbi:MAG: serine/threonine-protein kinase [Candidatus Ratteibacteria bacterium]|jgi:serine/threonine-protein kinase